MRLVKNVPLNTDIISRLFTDKDDLFLVWPKAQYPFNPEQWKKALDPEVINTIYIFLR